MIQSTDVGVEYELEEDDSIWITAKDLSINIRWCDEGVVVDVRPLDLEDMDILLGATWVLFGEGAAYLEEEHGNT